jgi:hypothetical protein
MLCQSLQRYLPRLRMWTIIINLTRLFGSAIHVHVSYESTAESVQRFQQWRVDIRSQPLRCAELLSRAAAVLTSSIPAGLPSSVRFNKHPALGEDARRLLHLRQALLQLLLVTHLQHVLMTECH